MKALPRLEQVGDVAMWADRLVAELDLRSKGEAAAGALVPVLLPSYPAGALPPLKGRGRIALRQRPDPDNPGTTLTELVVGDGATWRSAVDGQVVT